MKNNNKTYEQIVSIWNRQTGNSPQREREKQKTVIKRQLLQITEERLKLFAKWPRRRCTTNLTENSEEKISVMISFANWKCPNVPNNVWTSTALYYIIPWTYIDELRRTRLAGSHILPSSILYISQRFPTHIISTLVEGLSRGSVNFNWHQHRDLYAVLYVSVFPVRTVNF